MVYNDGMEESRFELSNLTPTPTPTPQLFIISDLHPGIYRSDRAAAAAGECIGDYTEQNLTIAVVAEHREFIDLEWIAHSPLTIECDLTENNEYGIPYRNIAYAVSADDLPAFIADILAKVEAAREAE